MIFHIEEGLSQTVFQGTSAAILIDYVNYLYDVFDLSNAPYYECWTPGSPFNTFDSVKPGTLYQWHAKQAFDIIT
jgi:hypothetical protein